MRFTDYRTFKTAIGGKLLELEIGKVCELANGQVMVRYGDTVVNVTACASKEPRPDIDFSRCLAIMRKNVRSRKDSGRIYKERRKT